MSRARNLSDLLDANGDVVSGALDNVDALPDQSGNNGKYLTTDGTDASWVSLSSNALTQSFPMASGGSVTAGKVVSLNASGEVGEYPVVNAYGTTRGSASSNSYSAVSLNGSRAIWVDENPAGGTKDNDDWDIDIYGYAITDSATAVEGGTVLRNRMDTTTTTHGYTWELLPVFAVSNDKFVVVQGWLGQTEGGPGNFVGAYAEITLVQVDSSGNVTSLANTGFSFTSSVYRVGDVEWWALATSGNSYIFVLELENGSGTTPVYRTVTIDTSANTISAATDAEGSSWNVATSRFGVLVNSGALLVKGNGNTLYTATYSTNNIASQSTASAGLPDYSSGGTWFFVSSSQAIVHYQNTDLDWVLANLSINQTTGAVTVEDTATWFSSTVPTNILSANGTDFVGMQAGTAFTFEVDGNDDFVKSADGSVKLGGTPAVPSYGSNIFLGINSTDVAWFNYTNTAGDEVMTPLTINAYSTDAFVIGGIAEETTSGATADVTVGGIVSGLSGLTINSNYYVDTTSYDGSITTNSAGDLVGKAISATALRLNFD